MLGWGAFEPGFPLQIGTGVMTRKHPTKTPKSSQPAPPSKPPLITRRRALFALGAVVAVGGGGWALFSPTPAMAEAVTVYKDPACECCGRWVDHLRRNGFTVVVNTVAEMNPVKRRAGIPETLESCHTAEVGGYAVEGHVPAKEIKRMLSERPAIRGLAVPGMPSSAPGMDSPEREPFTVIAFDAGGATGVFASY